MKYLILLFLVGCTGNTSLEDNLKTYGPDQHGVKCYRLYGTQGISCVKVVYTRNEE